jgi:hypothetical protein
MSEKDWEEHALALLEMCDWSVRAAKDLLVKQSRTAIIDGKDTTLAMGAIADVAPEIVRLAADHEVGLAKERWAADLRSRYAELFEGRGGGGGAG